MMTESEYIAKCNGFRKREWSDKEATMYVAFIVQAVMGGDGAETDFKKFYPPLDEIEFVPKTDEEIDKMFEECL